MPTLLSTQQIAIEWADLDKWQQIKQPKSARKRSSGVHLSGVLDYAIVQSGLMNKQEIDTEEMPLRMAVGMAWENWVVGLYPDMVWQPGEWESCGVYGTPDGLSIDYEHIVNGLSRTVVEEFKCTWYSMNKWKNILDAKRYIWQLCANCKALNTTYARLHVLWINGDYKDHRGPHYRTYLIQFSVPEINTFWANVIMKNKDKSQAEVHG